MSTKPHFDAQTSCLHEHPLHSNKQQELRQRCVESLQRKISGQYLSFLDPLAGTGDHAAVLAGGIMCWGSENARVNDIDPACAEMLRAKFQRVTTYDLGTDAERLFAPKVDLVYLDYNTFTLAKFHRDEKAFGTKGNRRGYRTITNLAFQAAAKFVIVNDCTVHGAQRYRHSSLPCYSKILGKTVSGPEDVLQSLPAYYAGWYPDWHLTDIEHFYGGQGGATSYILFRRTPQPLVIHLLTKDSL